jgi:hypothetical protein
MLVILLGAGRASRTALSTETTRQQPSEEPRIGRPVRDDDYEAMKRGRRRRAITGRYYIQGSSRCRASRHGVGFDACHPDHCCREHRGRFINPLDLAEKRLGAEQDDVPSRRGLRRRRRRGGAEQDLHPDHDGADGLRRRAPSVAGIVGVSNIMLISVRERTREIGIRKAIGATPWAIVSQIMLESLVVTGTSGYAGLCAGVGLIELVRAHVPPSDYFRNPEVNLGVVGGATVLLVFAGLLAGYFPGVSHRRLRAE